MEQLIEAMVKALNEAGLHAVAAMPGQVMPLLKSSMVAVDIAKANCRGAGLYHYLGIYQDQELYGRQLDATLQLDVYVPENSGGKGAREAMTQVINVLLAGVEALSMGEISIGNCEYNADCDCFTGKILVPVSAYGYATLSADGTAFEDFRLKGELK